MTTWVGRFAWMFAGGLLLSAISFSYWFYSVEYCPSMESAQKVLDAFEANLDSPKSLAGTTDLFKYLTHAKSKEEDEVLEYACERLRQIYLSTHHPAVFQCLNESMLSGDCCGFVNTVCYTYEQLMEDPAFFALFRDSGTAHHAFERCAGGSFSDDEVAILVSGRAASMVELRSMASRPKSYTVSRVSGAQSRIRRD